MRAPQHRHMFVMTEHSIVLCPNPNGGECLWQRAESGNLHASDVLETSRLVEFASNAICFGADLPRDEADMCTEPLPLAWNTLICPKGIARTESCDQEFLMILETWLVEVYQQGLIHTNGFHELNIIETTSGATTLGCDPELFVKRAGERFV